MAVRVDGIRDRVRIDDRIARRIYRRDVGYLHHITNGVLDDTDRFIVGIRLRLVAITGGDIDQIDTRIDLRLRHRRRIAACRRSAERRVG